MPNGDQADGDDIGDVCDRESCGNGVRELDEACDGLDAAVGPWRCHPDCTCPCSNLAPGAKVTVKMKNGAGQLTGKLLIAAGLVEGAMPQPSAMRRPILAPTTLLSRTSPGSD